MSEKYLSEIEIAIKCNITYSVWWCEAMTEDVRREETITFAALSGCAYNGGVCFVGVDPTFIVCHPARDITGTVTKLVTGKISVCYR